MFEHASQYVNTCCLQMKDKHNRARNNPFRSLWKLMSFVQQSCVASKRPENVSPLGFAKHDGQFGMKLTW